MFLYEGVFPRFKTIKLSDKDIIEKFTKSFPPYNDFEFTSLWTYNVHNNNAFSFLNDNLIIKVHDFIIEDYFYSFLGTTDAKNTIRILLQKSKEENLIPQLKLIPAINLKSLRHLQKHFSITEDPDSFDYILSVNKVALLQGNEYHDKRNLVNAFKRLYPIHSIELLDLTREKTKYDMKKLFFLWEKQRGKKRDETIIELTAFERLFDLVPILDLYAVGVYIKNKLIAFSTYHIVQDNFAILSFEKADNSYRGIYAYINQSVAKHLKSLNVKYINYEQDLGIPGLKKAKMLWRPVFFLKKYIIKDLVRIK